MCRHFPDRNPSNNRISNLQWGTRAENEADKEIHGTRLRGEQNGYCHYTQSQVMEVLLLHAAGHSQASIIRKTGIPQGQVHRFVHRQLWKHLTVPLLPGPSSQSPQASESGSTPPAAR